MLDETQFWAIIESTWPVTEEVTELRQQLWDGELEEAYDLLPILPQVCENLTQALSQLSQADLLAFDRLLERKLYDIDRAEIHAFTDGSDDGFLYCRGFIVGMGQAYYEAVNADPSRALIDAEFEELCYLPNRLYEERYGLIPPSGISRETGSNQRGWAEET